MNITKEYKLYRDDTDKDAWGTDWVYVDKSDTVENIEIIMKYMTLKDPNIRFKVIFTTETVAFENGWIK